MPTPTMELMAMVAMALAMLPLSPSDLPLVLTPSPRVLMPPLRATLPMLPMEAIMARGLLTPTMELMVLDLDMLLLFPSDPPPVLTPSPRALMPLPRAMLLMLPMEPTGTMARGPLMPTTPMVLL